MELIVTETAQSKPRLVYCPQGGAVLINRENSKIAGAYTTGMTACEPFAIHCSNTQRSVFIHLDAAERLDNLDYLIEWVKNKEAEQAYNILVIDPGEWDNYKLTKKYKQNLKQVKDTRPSAYINEHGEILEFEESTLEGQYKIDQEYNDTPPDWHKYKDDESSRNIVSLVDTSKGFIVFDGSRYLTYEEIKGRL